MLHLFVINPVAGKLKISEKLTLVNEGINKLPESIRKKDEFLVYVTKDTMDACKKVKQEAANGKPLRVYACGGDVTLNECVNAAAGRHNVAVTDFPCGTGNDFIKTFGEGKNSFSDITKLVTGKVKPLDLILCNGRYSINICSVGLDARVAEDVHNFSKRKISTGAFDYAACLALNVIKGTKSRMTATVDSLVCGPELNLVCVCNGRYYGGGFNPSPDARPDDGILDCLIVSGANRFSILRSIAAFSRGGYKKLPEYISYVRTNHIEVQAKSPQAVNLDGEIMKATRIVFDLIPEGVNFVIPEDIEF
ncbi:MAG: YegS/Rv2252/BmrU family lipid kinase [Ruminococcaceae bacterium]|nr:YegS/Rv2252/BmrU family lipid kinase [Oscillospiraceae bacterium]